MQPADLDALEPKTRIVVNTNLIDIEDMLSIVNYTIEIS